MTKNQILKKLENAGFNMKFVVDCSKNYLEVFTGDGADCDGNQHIKDEAVKITGLTHSCNIAYGGYMLSNESFRLYNSDMAISLPEIPYDYHQLYGELVRREQEQQKDGTCFIGDEYR